jgi:L-threonylcarbamoyladenylate synthase
VHWTETSRAIARDFWPGPLTLALPARADAFPDGVVSEDGLVALRSSPHPFVRALIGAWGGALTSTSANAPGVAPARDADDVEAALRSLDAADVLVLDGGTLPESLSSTILSVEDNEVRVLRVGAIGTDELRNQLSGIGIDVR